MSAEVPQRTIRLDLEFDGLEFAGWQRQPGVRTVQAEVEGALERVLGAAHRVVGAGRTDAGAHARHMVASFVTRATMAAPDLERALDAVLPDDVGVLALGEAPAGFHALRDARWKWYRYTLLPSRRKRPLVGARAWRVPWRLDRVLLAAGAGPLRGRHDFASFANAGSPRRTTVRTVWALAWGEEEPLLHLDVVGDGFLYRMVRSIVGTLVEHGRLRAGGACDPREAARAVRAVLEARDRTRAGRAAPAHGLCLMACGMDGEDLRARLPPWLALAVESDSNRISGGRS